ncbi:MAG: Cof-type HAD-IIB family hydrolase [Isosphaeraceae bacterium]|nr:Cof-type HAD-IIB family hydrolase [Isosphaeraceae bacterium]
MNRPTYRLLALDVDGTLLDRDGNLRSATVEAVRRAAEAGIQPVICTGRRYRRARPIAEMLGLDVPIVCNSGAIVKEPSDHSTLWRADLPREITTTLLDLLAGLDEPAVSFTDLAPHEADFVVERDPMGRPFFDDYLEQNRGHACVDPGWADRDSSRTHYHICAIGDRGRMLEVEAEIHRTLPGLVRTFVQRSPRYLGTMCEVLHLDASKWTAVLRLAELWGIAPEEICAVGDDHNDVPMIAGAGLGVAMGHAPREVLEVADHVTLSEEDDGLAHFIDGVLLARSDSSSRGHLVP